MTSLIIDTYHLHRLIDAVQTLALQETIRNNSFSIYNSYKILAGQRRYPWKKMLEQTPFSLKFLKVIEPWFGYGALYSANKEQGIEGNGLPR